MSNATLYSLIRRSPSPSFTASKKFARRNPKLSLASVCNFLWSSILEGTGSAAGAGATTRPWTLFSWLTLALEYMNAFEHPGSRHGSFSFWCVLASSEMPAESSDMSANMTNLLTTSATLSWSQALFCSSEPWRMWSGTKPSGLAKKV